MITRFLIAIAVLILLSTLAVTWMTGFEGSTSQGSPPALTSEEERVRDGLEETVRELAFQIGSRSFNRAGSYGRALAYLEEGLLSYGYSLDRQSISLRGRKVQNLAIEKTGVAMPGEVVLVGAHYDSFRRSPGANCNASGVAVLYELARMLRAENPVRTIRMVFLANGESPWQGTEFQGARVYAEEAKARGEKIVVAILLDAVGYYSTTENSQNFPFPLNLRYPTTGNFIAFFGTPGNKGTVEKMMRRWFGVSNVPAEGGAFPGWYPGIYGADHVAFAKAGYPAVMLTDTAENRWKDARGDYDSLKNLDYETMTRVTTGLLRLVTDLGRSGLN